MAWKITAASSCTGTPRSPDRAAPSSPGQDPLSSREPGLHSYNHNLGDGDDEPPAARTVLGLLGQDLLGEVPGKQQHVVGHLLQEPGGRGDGQMGARRE